MQDTKPGVGKAEVSGESLASLVIADLSHSWV